MYWHVLRGLPLMLAMTGCVSGTADVGSTSDAIPDAAVDSSASGDNEAVELPSTRSDTSPAADALLPADIVLDTDGGGLDAAVQSDTPMNADADADAEAGPDVPLVADVLADATAETGGSGDADATDVAPDPDVPLAQDSGPVGPGTSCGIPGLGYCAELEGPLPGAIPPVPQCLSLHPARAPLTCTIPTPGPQRYVATDGDDQADGTTPETAWRTLCHAAATVPDGGTVRVAAGAYLSAGVLVDRPITFKGGYSSDFQAWAPEAYQSVFGGRLWLDNSNATWGGFRHHFDEAVVGYPCTAGNCDNAAVRVASGRFVRNYVQFAPTVAYSEGNFTAVKASACLGSETLLECNEIYHAKEGTKPSVSYPLNYANHDGQGVVRDTRVCQTASFAAQPLLQGFGGCDNLFPPRLVVANTVMENLSPTGEAVGFYPCNDGTDFDLVLTNNTLMSGGPVLTGATGGSTPASATVNWRLSNNLLQGSGTGVDLVALANGGSVIVAADHNLVSGPPPNLFMPAPLSASGNDTGNFGLLDLFADPANGDLAPKAGGPLSGAGLNLYGDQDTGGVTVDLLGNERPSSGSWDVGALQN